MRTIATFIVVLACVLAITAAALDVRCVTALPAPDTFVLVCRAGRLSQLATVK